MDFQPQFDPAALSHTVHGLMLSVNELQSEMREIRSTVGEALDLLWRRTQKNEERCIRRFRACRKRLTTADATTKKIRQRIMNISVNNDSSQQQQQQQHTSPDNHYHHRHGADDFVSPVSLASAAAASPGGVNDARRLNEILHGGRGTSSSPEASTSASADKRRRLAAMKRQKQLEQKKKVASSSDDDDHTVPAQQKAAARVSRPIFVPLLCADLSFVSTGGAIVVRLPAGCPLDLSGVRLGDKILVVDGRALMREEDREWLLRRKPGDEPYEGDDDIFGADHDDAPTSMFHLHEGKINISVVPAKALQKIGGVDFVELSKNAVEIALPMSPKIKKQRPPQSPSRSPRLKR